MSGPAVSPNNVPKHESLPDIAVGAAQLHRLLRAAHTPVVVTHAKVDADAVGSTVAMVHLCRALGHRETVGVPGDGLLPGYLRFLDAGDVLVEPTSVDWQAADLFIFVDCADAARAGLAAQMAMAARTPQKPVVNVDHHVTNTRFGDLDLVVPDAAATCQILERMFEALQVPIGADCATVMLAGIYGDPLGLKTPSSTPDAMRASAMLVESGADLDTIVDHLFRKKPYSSIKLWGEALQHVDWRGRLIWAYVDQDMLNRAGAEMSEAEGFVNFITGAIGAFAAALLYKEEKGWRVSLRSIRDDVNVSDLAKRYGGGGHPRAAGATLPPGDDARDAFLDDIAAQLAVLPEIDEQQFANAAQPV
jgi:phosphoesterase RecJ-like protein